MPDAKEDASYWTAVKDAKSSSLSNASGQAASLPTASDPNSAESPQSAMKAMETTLPLVASLANVPRGPNVVGLPPSDALQHGMLQIMDVWSAAQSRLDNSPNAEPASMLEALARRHNETLREIVHGPQASRDLQAVAAIAASTMSTLRDMRDITARHPDPNIEAILGQTTMTEAQLHRLGAGAAAASSATPQAVQPGNTQKSSPTMQQARGPRM